MEHKKRERAEKLRYLRGGGCEAVGFLGELKRTKKYLI